MYFPFSEKARQLAKTQGFQLNSEAISLGQKFIEEIVLGKQRELQVLGDMENIKLLAVCKAILSLCPYFIAARFADNYSKLWQKFFADNSQQAVEFASEVFPSLSVSARDVKISVFDYLNAEESLFQVQVSNGTVFLTNEQLVKVLARQVKRKVLSAPSSASLPLSLKKAASELSTRFVALTPVNSKHLEKQEVKKIRLGVAEGNRYYSCMKLVRACFLDNLSFEEAKQVLLDFVKACPQGKNPFTEKEGLACLEWTYRKTRR